MRTLLMGGAKRIRSELTRKSLVTHYCSVRAKPNFASFASSLYHLINHSSGHYYCSRYYNTNLEFDEGNLIKPVFLGGQGSRIIVEWTGRDLFDRTKARPQTLIQKHPQGVTISCECKDSGIVISVDPLFRLTKNYEIKLELNLLYKDVVQLFYLQPEQKTSVKNRVSDIN